MRLVRLDREEFDRFTAQTHMSQPRRRLAGSVLVDGLRPTALAALASVSTGRVRAAVDVIGNAYLSGHCGSSGWVSTGVVVPLDLVCRIGRACRGLLASGDRAALPQGAEIIDAAFLRGEKLATPLASCPATSVVEREETEGR